MFSRLSSYLALRPYWIALFIVVALVLWMLSKNTEPAATAEPTSSQQEHIPSVQTTHFIPQSMTKSLTLYGKSEANSSAIIRAEIAGKIADIPTKKGRNIRVNTKLVELEKNELPQSTKEAEALLSERQLNYDAAKSLSEKGLQGRARLAEVKSLLLSAKTRVRYLQLQLQRTEILAPFSGVLQEQYAEQGDYVQIGDPIFSLENIDPIIIRGNATEHYIHQLTVGEPVVATLLSGEEVTGKITYIASFADTKSSTFRIEAEFSNPDLKIFSGISARLSIPLYPVEAIYVSPSALAIDKDGNLGVKLVKNGIVEFKAINLVEADNDGAWLSGFSEPVDIITLGQGFVKPGDPVNAIAAEK